MIIVFTGNGKGKTTAALGQTMRTMGRGKKVLMIQFIKGPWKSGEDTFAKKVQDAKKKMMDLESGKEIVERFPELYNFEIRKMGLGFVGILGDSLPLEDHQAAAKKALEMFKEELPNFDFIVLDELNVALSLNLLKIEDVLESLENVEDEKLVLMTGRGAPQELIDRADLVTEMREIKHPFNDGRLAKIAVEF
ncbi:MAG: cob(I)yrinic acid a,c-diamide adenosyltransferase [Patescibacteria group bacterium]